jgi:hypothetical protein
MKFHCRIFLTFVSILLIFNFPIQVVVAQAESSSARWNPPMRIPSPDQAGAKSPAITVDSTGRVHIVWVQITKIDAITSSYSTYYSSWDGNQWTQFNDIIASSLNPVHLALTADNQDHLDLLFNSDPSSSLFFADAEARNAFSAPKWTDPYVMSNLTPSSFGDITVDGNSILAVYEDSEVTTGNCTTCTDIYFRSSSDHGTTWSTPTDLFPTEGNSIRPAIQADLKGNIYVTWNEGVDTSLVTRKPTNGIFEVLKNDADRWSSPMMVNFPNNSNIQFGLGQNGRGGIMLVWRTTETAYPGIYYMYSADYGRSWSPPQTIPGILAFQTDTDLEKYSIAADSSGHIHVLAVGFPNETNPVAVSESSTGVTKPSPPGVYHLEWDGQRWLNPISIYRGGWYPFAPKITIFGGNQLYAVWHIQDDPQIPKLPSQIYFADGISTAKSIKPVPVAPLIDQQALTPTAEPVRTVNKGTGVPTLDSSPPLVDLSSFNSERDTYLLIGIGLIPVLIIIIIALVFSRRIH